MAECTIVDVVAAAKSAGCTSSNVQSLAEFLLLYDDWFSSDDFNAFVAITNYVRENLIDPKTAKLFPDKTTATLTEAERLVLWDSFTNEELEEMLGGHIDATIAYGSWFSMWCDSEGRPAFSGVVRDVGAGRFVSYISEHGTTPEPTSFDGTLTEDNLPTLTAVGYVHTGWVLTYPHAGWVDVPVYVGFNCVFGPLLKAVWVAEGEEEPEEQPEMSKAKTFLLHKMFSKPVAHDLTGKWSWLE